MPRLSISLDIAANPLSFLYGTTAIYVASGLLPEFIADFSREFYKTNSGIKTFANAITHTRASTATMVDSDGVLKWGPHNVIPDSEGMTGWSDVNTATSSAADGVLTISLPAEADYVSESITITVPTGSTWTVKLEIKGPVGEDITVRIARTGVGTYEQNSVAVVFTGDWQTVSVSHTFAASHTGLRLDIVRLAGQGAGPVYARKASMYRSDLGGMVDNPDTGNSYVPTTSEARYLPRVGHHVWNGTAWVNEGLLHESEARTNLLTYSNDLTNAAWNKNRCTATAGGAVGPDGLSSLFEIEATETNVNGMTANSTVTIASGSTTTVSGFSRVGTNDWMIAVGFDGSSSGARQWFNLSTGAVGSANSFGTGWSVSSASIVAWGSGLYRWSVTFATVGTTFTNTIFPSVPADLDFDCTIGDVGYVGFVQSEAGPTPSSYIPTSGSTVTRAADVLTIPAANLPWPSPVVIGPELVTNGTFDADISGWDDLSASGGSIAWNPAGYLDLVNVTAVGRTQQPFALEEAKVYQIVATNVSGGDVSVRYQSTVSPFPSVVFGTIAAGQTQTFVFVGQYGADSAIDFRNFTTGTTVSLDNISVREINPLAVSIQMDGRVTYADQDQSIAAYFVDWELNADNRIIELLRTSSGTGNYSAFQEAFGVVDRVDSDGSYFSPDILVPYNIAARHGSTFVNGAVDGVALTANTTPTALPDLSATNLTLGRNYLGTIRTFRIWSQDITDAGLVEATEPSLVPSLSLTFDGTENSFIVEDWSE